MQHRVSLQWRNNNSIALIACSCIPSCSCIPGCSSSFIVSAQDPQLGRRNNSLCTLTSQQSRQHFYCVVGISACFHQRLLYGFQITCSDMDNKRSWWAIVLACTAVSLLVACAALNMLLYGSQESLGFGTAGKGALQYTASTSATCAGPSLSCVLRKPCRMGFLDLLAFPSSSSSSLSCSLGDICASMVRCCASMVRCCS